MASTCVSKCVADAGAPVRATYTNLYKWPESDLAFVRSLSANSRNTGMGSVHPPVVDSISCRQLYLRSYKFSRKNSKTSPARRIKEKMAARKAEERKKSKLKRGGADGGGKSSCVGFKKAKEMSCVAMGSIFRRLLSCTTKIDVVG